MLFYAHAKFCMNPLNNTAVESLQALNSILGTVWYKVADTETLIVNERHVALFSCDIPNQIRQVSRGQTMEKKYKHNRRENGKSIPNISFLYILAL